MKKVLMGILLGLTVLCHPINVYAESAEITELTYDDAQLLLKTAQAEAGNQGVTGMWLIMCVVMNRMESEDFPNTIEEVISQKGQFATYANGAIEQAEPSADCHMALAYLESGERAKSIIAFESVDSDYLERYFWRAFSFRDHCFYTKK